jgi:hypothetical protein
MAAPGFSMQEVGEQLFHDLGLVDGDDVISVAGLLGRSGEFVAQIPEQSPVIGRIRQPRADEVVVSRCS